jgi:hypothetical protein
VEESEVGLQPWLQEAGSLSLGRRGPITPPEVV